MNVETTVTLSDKSFENRHLLDMIFAGKKVSGESVTHAVAGRSYYAVFQKIKHMAMPIYNNERKINPGLKMREFLPHGSELLNKLNQFITNGYFSATLNLEELREINRIEWLYELRRRADYHAKHKIISVEEVKRAKAEADIIISIVDKLKLKEGRDE